jgi:transcription elongation GreA/GreB family factor
MKEGTGRRKTPERIRQLDDGNRVPRVFSTGDPAEKKVTQDARVLLKEDL